MEVFFVSISKHSSFFCCCCCLTWGGRSGRNGRNPLDLDSHTYLTLTQALYLQVTSSPLRHLSFSRPFPSYYRGQL